MGSAGGAQGPTDLGVDVERLAERYASADEYLAAYEAAADAAIDAGWVLAEDRQELLDMAQPDVIPS